MAKPHLRGAVWWIRYYDRHGKKQRESSGSTKISVAKELLKLRQGEVARGVPISPAVTRLRFDEAAADVFTDYRTSGKRSVDDVESRIKNHLTPYFGGRRMVDIRTADVRAYTAQRQEAGAANATINRELAVLKRAFVLAVQGEKLVSRPHIPMLKEPPPRQGFFEAEQFEAVRRHLPEAVQRLVTFECVTGWRNYSEVYPMQWSWVDFDRNVVRMPAGIAKNQDGRTFPMTKELRALLLEQRAHVEGLQGHRTESVYRRYAIVAEADLHEAARRLERVAQ